MSEVNKEKKVAVEQKHIRARNMYEVVNQIVEEFNSSNGWALVKVNPMGLNLEVFLERSSKQAGGVGNESPKDVVEDLVKEDKEVSKETAPKATGKSKVVGDKKVTPTKKV